MISIAPRHFIPFLLLSLVLAASVCQAGTVKPFIPSQSAKTTVAATATPAPATVTPAAPADDAAPPAVSEAVSAPVPDPLYYWNKFWFRFNDLFLGGLMRPLANGYAIIVPKQGRTALANAYQNFIFPIRFINALLQLNFTKASREFGRFMLNTTFGVGGLMDVAKSDPNLQPGNSDFGQTLGHYGMGEGFYIVWPLLGPSSLRDSIGMAGDAAANPLIWIFGPWAIHDDYNPWYWPYIIKGADMFNRMPDTLENYDSIVKSSIEPYSAVKDAYLQYRRNELSK